MGCDIHLYVERREGDRWVSCDQWEGREDDDSCDVVYKTRFYSNRNYDLFAILANVRNSFGFAGVTTGVGFIPISEPKGLPEDVSDLVRGASDSWGGDGHSHSWHTIADLMAYDWTQTTVKMGVVSAPQYLEWIRWRKGEGLGPESYAGDVGGGGTKHIPVEDMDSLCRVWLDRLWGLHGGEAYNMAFTEFKETCGHLYTRVSWSSPYFRRASEFLSETLPKLWRLGKPEDVRIVFWFDN